MADLDDVIRVGCSSQTFVAPDGEEYAWEHHKHKLAGKDICKVSKIPTVWDRTIGAIETQC